MLLVFYKRNRKQKLNHKLAAKKVSRAIKFNQKVLLKPEIKMNIDLRKKAKNDFEKKNLTNE